MKQLIHQNNVNKLNFLKSSLANDFTKIKNFILNLNIIINLISSGIKELLPSLEIIDNILPYFIGELGLPFCDIMNETDIIKYYFNQYITNKSQKIKNILLAFIQCFNFNSADKTQGDILIQLLSSYDESFNLITANKRKDRTEIEDIYESINSTYMKSNEENKPETKKEILDKIGLIEQKKAYPISQIQYLKEKIEAVDKNVKMINMNNIQLNNIFGYISCLTDYFQAFNSFQNVQNNNNNNTLEKEEPKKLSDIPLQDRTFLYKDEQLIDEENEYTEFKNYTYPFAQDKINEIKRQYCGFLNSHGGRIYLGISDLRVVKGMHLDYKLCDIIKNELINYTYDFYPKCRIDKINVYFLKVKSMQTYRFLKNLFVIKIQVMPGEPYNLYSINNKSGYISSLRLPGQCINLTAEEIHSEIMKRGDLLKQKYIQEYNIANENNDIKEDNKESVIEEVSEDITDENQKEDENSDEESDGKGNKKKVVYVVKITNIDTSLKIKDINRYFNGSGACLQKFPAIEGKSQGFGEIHFPKKEPAKAFIRKFNNMNLCGNKKILMKLKKKITRGN